MASSPSYPVVRDLRVAELLERPRYEVIPVRGIEDKVAALPAGSRVTVTASPGHGQARTIEVAESLAASGYEVIPHLAARMVSGRSELAGWAGRLAAAGVHEAFVVGGDATPAAGPYRGRRRPARRARRHLASVHAHRDRRLSGGPPADRRRQAARGAAPQAAVRRPARHAALLRRRRAPRLGAGDPRRRASTCRSSSGSLASSSGASWPRSRSRPGSALRCATCASTGASWSPSHARGATIPRRSCAPSRRGWTGAPKAPSFGIRGAHLFTFNQVEPTFEWVGEASPVP